MLDILKHVNVLNILLVALILIFALYALLPLVSTGIFVPLPAAKETIEDKDEAEDEKEAAPSPIEFTLIAEQNLFHPERKLPEKTSEKDLPKPEFVLYGTLITDKMSFAYMDDKKALKKTEGRQKRQTALKIGDSLSGFVLKTVEQDKVVMVRGQDSLEVRVIDPVNKKRESVKPEVKDAKQPVGRATSQGPAARERPTTTSSPLREGLRQRGDTGSSQQGRFSTGKPRLENLGLPAPDR